MCKTRPSKCCRSAVKTLVRTALILRERNGIEIVQFPQNDREPSANDAMEIDDDDFIEDESVTELNLSFLIQGDSSSLEKGSKKKEDSMTTSEQTILRKHLDGCLYLAVTIKLLGMKAGIRDSTKFCPIIGSIKANESDETTYKILKNIVKQARHCVENSVWLNEDPVLRDAEIEKNFRIYCKFHYLRNETKESERFCLKSSNGFFYCVFLLSSLNFPKETISVQLDWENLDQFIGMKVGFGENDIQPLLSDQAREFFAKRKRRLVEKYQEHLQTKGR